jgi:hypothetical protein
MPASALAMRAPVADSDLSPRLAELARPAVRALPPAAQARRLGLAPSGPGSLLRDGDRVLVDVRFAAGAIAALDALRAAGAEVLAPSRSYQTVTVAIAPASLSRLAAVPGVEGVSERRAPLLYGGGSPAAAALGAECEGGSVISEGIAQLQVAAARSKHSLDGSGVTVGVLSDSYDEASLAADESGPVATHASEDVQSGDLPGPANSCAGEKTPVAVLEDFASPEAGDEGRAMLQIVHDVAPGATLAFATAFFSELSFAQNIERLAKPVGEGGAGADVIVDDVAWFEEPFFQDGPIAAAVNKVVAEGVPYFSAAGNNNLFEGGNEIASWEAPSFRDSLTCPPAVLAFAGIVNGHCMDFNPNPLASDDEFEITVAAGATLTLDLQWAEPWFGVETDLDAYLLNAGGTVIAAEETDNVANTQKPVEVLQWENTSATARTVRLVINRCGTGCNPAASDTATPLVKFALLENGSGVTKTEYPTSAEGDTVGPNIFGHAGADAAAAIAAVPYNDSDQVESYSSRGPVTHFFEPVSGTTPAAPLASAETIAKPDVAATDCGATTFFAFLAGDGEWRFCGTSAAAPHAAGVAALELEAKPAASVAEIRAAQTVGAAPIPGFGPSAAGAGLLDADATLANLLPPAVVTITDHPASRTADSTPTFEFEASAGTEFTCAIDGGAAEPCTPGTPYTPSPLFDGSHLFEVVGVDVVGSASFSFTVDTTPPGITVTQRPSALSSDSTPVFAFSADEPAAFTCALDGAAAQPCKSPFAPPALPDGAHSLVITATDQVGNSGQAMVGGFSIDTVAPVITFTEVPAAKSADPRPTFGFSANEPASFTCATDAGVALPCASLFAVPRTLADGSHTFEVRATDLAGNVAPATDTFAIDTRRPQTLIVSHPRSVLPARRGGTRASFRFGSDEAGVAFLCKIDRGSLRFCGADLARRFGLGRHTLRVKAQDEVGNVDDTPAVFRFRVKRPA